jgi:hypothetical protein
MDDKRTPKRILQWKPIGTRTRGRPRKRWIAGIEENLQIMGVRRWRKQCEERAEWKKITEKAKTHSGLLTPVKGGGKITSSRKTLITTVHGTVPHSFKANHNLSQKMYLSMEDDGR